MQFNYQAKNSLGQMIQGSIEASGENEAVAVLQEKGFVVLSLRQVGKDIFTLDVSQYLQRANDKDIVVFTRQLSVLIDADMPLAEGLRTLAKQVEKSAFRKVLGDVSDSVEGGSSLSASLAMFPDLFSTFYIKLVKAGEISGKLHESLNYLADYLERSQAINSKIRGALAYPAFVLSAMALVVFVVMPIFVLPNLLSVFKESNVDLPVTTRALIWMTDFFNEYMFHLLVSFIIAVGVFVSYIRSDSGKIWFDDVKIRVPVFGRILKNLYLARVAETLSTLIKSDIAILDSIRVTSDLVGNITFQEILLAAEENVRGGGSISDIFGKYADMPPLMTSMIAIGEKTGKLEYMLGHVSKFYRTESENDINNISQLIEPILIVTLGIGVAVLVASILLPMFSLMNAA